ncbi:MAG: hypothetical protein K2Q33_05005 [Gammaproteobacteria bacterium]|nr:hypothetical protein [Gammaproteobacteria bacterium]
MSSSLQDKDMGDAVRMSGLNIIYEEVTNIGSINDGRTNGAGSLNDDNIVQQSDAFLKWCIDYCANTSKTEHTLRAGITATSFAGSVAFFLGAKQLFRDILTKLLGNSPAVAILANGIGIDSMTLSSLPLAGMGVTTAQDIQPMREEEKIFLEPHQRSTVAYILRVSFGFVSAAPVAGMTYYVFLDANGVLLWAMTAAAFAAMSFGTIPSMLSMGKGTPNELKPDEEGLNLAQLLVLKKIDKVMENRIKANIGKLSWLNKEELPQNSIDLLNFLLKDPAPSYSAWLKFFIAAGTTISALGMIGYAGSTGLLLMPIFNGLSHIPQLVLENLSTGFAILAFGNLMRLSCKGGFSDLYRALAAVRSKEGLIDFIKKEILTMRFFPKTTALVIVSLGILAIFTGGTNFEACYEMTLPVLNALTDGYWEKSVPSIVTNVLQWITAVCGAINSDFFNGRGSMIAILNIFLLQYGHLFLKDDGLSEILKFVDGSQLYLRRFESCPLGKKMLLLDNCQQDIVRSVVVEAEKDNQDEEAQNAVSQRWPEIRDAIKQQRSGLSDSRYVFLNKPGETAPLLPATADDIENSACCRPGCTIL